MTPGAHDPGRFAVLAARWRDPADTPRLERQLNAAMKGDSKVTWDVRVRYVGEPADFSDMSAAERRALSVPKSFIYQPSIDGTPSPRIRIPNA